MSDVKAGGAYVEISADTKPLEGALKGISDKLKSFSTSASEIGGNLFAVGAAIKSSFGAAYHSAIENEKVETKLAAVMKMTGRAGGDNIEIFKARADAMQDVTTFDNDAVMSAQTTLAAFKGINNAKFDRVLAASADLAAFWGTDVADAAWTMGRAMEDPTLGMTILRRSGIMLTDQEKELIKQFEKVGNTAGAQDVILKKMETSFGGMAKTMAGTTAGAWSQMYNAIDDTGKILGRIFLPMLKDTADYIKGIAGPVQEWIQANSPLLVSLAKMAAAATAAGAALIGMGKVLGVLSAVVTPLGLITIAVLAILDATDVVNFGLDELVGNFQVAGKSISEWMLIAYKEIYKGWITVESILSNGLLSLVDMFQNTGDQISTYWNQMWLSLSKGMLGVLEEAARVANTLASIIQEATGVKIGRVPEIDSAGMGRFLDMRTQERQDKADKERVARWNETEQARIFISQQAADEIAKLEMDIDKQLGVKEKDRKQTDADEENRKKAAAIKTALGKGQLTSMTGETPGAGMAYIPGAGIAGGGQVVGQYGAAGWQSGAWGASMAPVTDKMLEESEKQTDYQKQMVNLLSNGKPASFGA